MSARPEPPEDFPADQAIAVPDPQWRIETGRPCRRARGRRACRAPSVMALNRGRRSWRHGRTFDSWWAYCADHTYGRWIEDGQVLHWIRKQEVDA